MNNIVIAPIITVISAVCFGTLCQASDFGIDQNNDGYFEGWAIDTVNDGTADLAAYDTDGDGFFDFMMLDRNNDGTSDVFATDSDEDGIYNVFNIDSDFDGQADQIETDLNANHVLDSLEIAGQAPTAAADAERAANAQIQTEANNTSVLLTQFHDTVITPAVLQ